ncbi:MAG TPA: hypothetical protein VFB28_01460 [Terriglobales bacterium]|nr:hypothetical protein [Terriglobales bacterium]
MHTQAIVVFPGDSGSAKSLLSALDSSFHLIHQASSLAELRSSIAKHSAHVAIVDMEAASFADLQHVSQEFPHVCIVCMHRCADEEMWAAALDAGASDLYHPAETAAIVRAALKGSSSARAAAA